jgi:hypothetical protein
MKFKKGQSQFHRKNTILKLNRIITELNKVVQDLEAKEFYKRDCCEKCGIDNRRFRLDGSYFCYSCGFDSKKKEEKK